MNSTLIAAALQHRDPRVGIRLDTGSDSGVIEAAGAPRCPACTSWEVTRHVEGFRVWFTCNRCSAVFGR